MMKLAASLLVLVLIVSVGASPAVADRTPEAATAVAWHETAREMVTDVALPALVRALSERLQSMPSEGWKRLPTGLLRISSSLPSPALKVSFVNRSKANHPGFVKNYLG